MKKKRQFLQTIFFISFDLKTAYFNKKNILIQNKILSLTRASGGQISLNGGGILGGGFNQPGGNTTRSSQHFAVK